MATRSAGSIFWWLSLLRVLARERVAPPEQSSRVMEASVGPHGIATRAKTRTRTFSTATTDTTPRHRRAEQGRSAQRPRPSRVPQPQGRDTRPHLRAPTRPGFRPQPRHRRHRPVEHRLPRISHHGPPGPGLEQHLSPLGWEHINLTGDYTWRPNTRGPGRYRPLGKPPRRP